ncbi:MAG TPA: hypothetical protein VLH38_02950 [Patescibacteria group bacterium]|nr:hypothetical protein [Patescibacteria group bacterium]
MIKFGPLSSAEKMYWKKLPEDLRQAQRDHARMAGRWLMLTGTLDELGLATAVPRGEDVRRGCRQWPTVHGAESAVDIQIASPSITSNSRSSTKYEAGFFQITATARGPRGQSRLRVGHEAVGWVKGGGKEVSNMLGHPGCAAAHLLIEGYNSVPHEELSAWVTRTGLVLRSDEIAGRTLFANTVADLQNLEFNPDLVEALGSLINPSVRYASLDCERTP